MPGETERQAAAEQLAADIADFIQRGLDDTGVFDALARAVFAYQFQHNAPYQAFCQGRGVLPGTVTSWRDIPAAPAAAFKCFSLTCAPEEACLPERGGRIFHSSGTTGAETSCHFLDAPALGLYRVSLNAGYGRFVLPDSASAPILALMLPPGDAPNSSLSFMLGELVERFGGRFLVGDGWQQALAEELRTVAHPVTVFGTAFAWVHFFDAVSETFSLPAGSRIVETGGFKGRSREVSRDELYNLFTVRLGVPRAFCLAEYGMSEMASQFYDSSLSDAMQGIRREPRKVGPYWVRTRVIDPVTGSDAVPGEPGLLAHYDLANLNSVMAIQTEDYGHACTDSDGFVLLGRAPGAVLRGCSLTAEERNARR